MDNIITVNALTKIYKKKNLLSKYAITALDDVSFSVKKGEVVGILGPNGSGKTTLFKLMLGLCNPSKGSVRIFGEDPKDVSIKHKIGFMPESPYLYDFLTAEEMLNFYGGLFDIEKSVLKEKVARLLNIVDLERSKRLRIRNYSKGMMQRVALASALVNDPELLFLDEPTIGLDPIGIHDMVGLIKKLKSEGRTIIIASHFMYEVEQYCSRVLILNKGRLLKDSSLDDLTVGGGEGYPKRSVEEVFISLVKNDI